MMSTAILPDYSKSYMPAQQNDYSANIFSVNTFQLQIHMVIRTNRHSSVNRAG
jgi:hypothetical protein